VGLSPSACLSQESAPSITPFRELPPYHLLGGGTLTSNDFIISIWLYCDPSLRSTDVFAEDYSEIGQLGLHYEWLYRGQSSDSGPMTSIIINGEATRRGSRSGPLQSGDTEADTGPIKTPSHVAAKAAATGQPIEFAVGIDVGGVVTTASLTVSLQAFPEGYRLSSVTLSVPAK
jgi:hypothetical protein